MCPQGAWVVDYCFISHSDIDMFNDCTMYIPSELISSMGAVLFSIPDHSFIILNIHIAFSVTDISKNNSKQTYTKYDVRNIPESFFTR